ARLGRPSADRLRLVRGSHIVVPALYPGEHAFILQNDDRRVVFMIPYEARFTLVGTTDVAHPSAAEPARATDAEVEYLCRAVNRYLARPLRPQDAVWTYAGVRPLYDDGGADPSKVTRDYALRVDDEAGEAPVLSVFGGKITTYRRLAEHALERLRPYFAGMGPPWTASTPLAASDFGASRAEARAAFFARHAHLPLEVRQGLFRRHGARAMQIAGDGDLGEHYGAGLTERELAWFVEHEWARELDDVLWRRTKAGLVLEEAARRRVRAALERLA
ncbi:MAG: FAD-dependent oxidoreductase, partial [Burkholderiales bacterium]|nr:FAD-dependent oxidoreductase [Burkholderiales bacterium]